jgi:hypothetical protein
VFKPKGVNIEKPPIMDDARKIYIDAMKRAGEKYSKNIHDDFYSNRFKEERLKLYHEAYEQGKFDTKAELNNLGYDDVLIRLKINEHRDIFNDIVE